MVKHKKNGVKGLPGLKGLLGLAGAMLLSLGVADGISDFAPHLDSDKTLATGLALVTIAATTKDQETPDEDENAAIKNPKSRIADKDEEND